MLKNIGYHTRLCADNAVKVCGGSFGGQIDLATVERLVKAHFTVKVLPSGRPTFVDQIATQAPGFRHGVSGSLLRSI